MINPRISAVWSKTKQIAPFSCTPGVQEVHTKAHGCSRNAMFGTARHTPEIFFHAWIHIATAHPVFLLPYYGLCKRSIVS